jgi:glycosyltransferase involved in cell wall biosynthesis
MPKVSVIIPTYNREKLIGRAIESVLAQTYTDFEIIVVDDGSKDNTKVVVQQYKGNIKYVYQPNGGSSSARNRGIKESTGEYIAFLDSDDIWIQEKLAIQVDILDRNKNIGIVCSRMPIFDKEGRQIGFKPQEHIGKDFNELIAQWGDLPTSTVMTRRECFDKAGLFDTSLKTVQDFDMWLRIARQYDIYEYKDQCLARYFRHGVQNTSNWANVLQGLFMLHKKIAQDYKHLPDFPHHLYRERIVLHQYWLSRALYDQKNYVKSFRHLASVIFKNPLVGRLLYKKSDGIFRKLVIMLKPYGFLAICSLLCLAQIGGNIFARKT